MKTVSMLQEEIAELRDEASAIVSVAENESRELAEDEQARFDAIYDKELPELEAKIEKREKIEALQRQQAAMRMKGKLEEHIEASKPEHEQRLTVPAKAKAHRKLKAFVGENAERDAYISGQALIANLTGNPSAVEFCRNRGLDVVNVQSTGDNSKGGFLVPEELSSALVRLREERGIFPRYANVFPMGADIVNVPRLLADVTSYWTGENSEITASDVTLGSAELMARKIACLTRFSREFDEESVIDVADMITTSMAYAMADKIDDAAFNGDGSSTYGGVVGLKNALVAAAIQDAATGNDSALTLDLADFEAVVGKLPVYPGASPVWFVHSAVFYASMARLQNAAGGNAIADLAGGPQMQFMGYPVVFTQVLPSTTGTAAETILAYFGDLSLAATYGTRRAEQTEISTERYFEYDQIGLRSTARVAINIHERGDTIRTRPIVALKTAS